MNTKKNFVTGDGLKKMQDELDELKTTKRKEIAERIADAKELGDLSENAEYIEAKEEQGFVESRILELEQMLKNVEVIAHKKNTKVVQIGSTVEVKNTSTKAKTSYTIVGSSEADPASFKISNESPFGEGFLNKEVGDKVNVKTPTGEVPFEIISIV
ncbi:MAG: transcription elongation factor GreA [Candidatus Kerfeldbacteria bacterium]|nr:transcription elongation factor GreA [Candidatus Kerfeldbacteria bacterium]